MSATWTMSALGQKQTFCDARAMSALPPKADMCGATRYVRFVPKADISKKKNRLAAVSPKSRLSTAGVKLSAGFLSVAPPTRD